MAVQLAVRRDQCERRLDRCRSVVEPGGHPLGREPIGIRGGIRLERDRRRQPGVVEDDDDGSVAAEIDPIRDPGVDRLRRLPRGKDGELDSLGDRLSQGRRIDRGLGQPEAPRTVPEAELEVADAPRDLGPAIGRRGERQDRVMVRLGDRRSSVGDEPSVRLRMLRGQPRRHRRSEVPRDVGEGSALRVRPVTLVGDPVVPVSIRRRRRFVGHPARPWIDAQGLVEVGVDRQAPARHPGMTGTLGPVGVDPGARADATSSEPTAAASGVPMAAGALRSVATRT